jgi:hypothetical protein
VTHAELWFALGEVWALTAAVGDGPWSWRVEVDRGLLLVHLTLYDRKRSKRNGYGYHFPLDMRAELFSAAVLTMANELRAARSLGLETVTT